MKYAKTYYLKFNEIKKELDAHQTPFKATS